LQVCDNNVPRYSSNAWRSAKSFVYKLASNLKIKYLENCIFNIWWQLRANDYLVFQNWMNATAVLAWMGLHVKMTLTIMNAYVLTATLEYIVKLVRSIWWFMPPSHMSVNACRSLWLRNATNRTKIPAVIPYLSALRRGYLTVTASVSFVSLPLTDGVRKCVRFQSDTCQIQLRFLVVVINVTYELRLFAQYLRILTYESHIFAYHLLISSRYWYFTILYPRWCSHTCTLCCCFER
jgi:hypothetical protein